MTHKPILGYLGSLSNNEEIMATLLPSIELEISRLRFTWENIEITLCGCGLIQLMCIDTYCKKTTRRKKDCKINLHHGKSEALVL